MVIVKNKLGRPSELQIRKQLADLLQPLFATSPSLEFQDYLTQTSIDDTKVITGVSVYDGEQYLGKVAYITQMTRSGAQDVYQIHSRRIKKERGDRQSRTTSNLKSALKIAREVFFKDPEHILGARIFAKLKSDYASMVWHTGAIYKDKCHYFYESAFEYVINVIDGNPAPIDPKLFQVVQTDAFRQARDNHRITKAISRSIERDLGAVVYVDREDRLSLYDAETKAFRKVESTYDLPKNYQEKYTMLKVVDLNQPVEHVGVKMELEVNDGKKIYFYLCPGDTVITH